MNLNEANDTVFYTFPDITTMKISKWKIKSNLAFHQITFIIIRIQQKVFNEKTFIVGQVIGTKVVKIWGKTGSA